MRKVSGQSLHMQRWAAFVLVGLLAGCSTIENVVGPIGNMGGLGDVFKQGPATDPNNPNPTQTTGVNADEDCPAAQVRQGASAWAQNDGAGPTNVRYQASITQIARECAVLGSTMTIKVGVEGRVVVGPKGGAGTASIPVRIAIVQEGPQPRPVVSKFYSVQVNVPQGSTQVPFTHVDDDLTFPIPADKNLEKYVIYVGFDPQGAPPAKAKAKPKPKPKPAPKKQAPAQQQPQGFQPQSQQQPQGFQPPSSQQQQPTFQPPPQQEQPTFQPPPKQ